MRIGGRGIAVLIVAACVVAGGLFWRMHHRATRSRSLTDESESVAATPNATDAGRRRTTDELRGRIAGIVRTADGKPVRDALIILSSTGFEVEGERVPMVRTDPRGRFLIDHVEDGEYALTASAPGQFGTFKDGLILDKGHTRIDVDLMLAADGIIVHGTVFDAEAGIVASPVVTATVFDRHRRGKFQATGHVDGTYELALSRANYSLEAAVDGYERGLQEAEGRETHESRLQVDFHLKPETVLYGRVVERDSKRTVAGATVFVCSPAPNPYCEERATTDGEGAFAIRNERRTGSVRARKGELAGEVPGVTATVGATEVVVAIGRAHSVLGRVVDRSGTPIANVDVGFMLGTENGQMPLVGINGQVKSDREGKYRLDGLLPGQYTVGVTGLRYVGDSRNIRIIDVDVPGIELVVEHSGILSGRVVNQDGTPVDRAFVRARRGASNQADRDDPFGITDEKGGFWIFSLPAGAYSLHADADDGVADVDGVHVTGEHPTKDVTLTLRRIGCISGTVRYDDGAVASGMNVQAHAVEGDGGQFAKSNSEGLYRLCALQPGKYRVTTRASLFSFTPEPDDGPVVAIVGTEERRGIDLAVPRRSLAIDGVVVDANGHPVAAASIRAHLGEQFGSTGGATTTSDGAFHVAGLSAGTYRLVVEAEEFPLEVVRDVRAGTKDLRVQLKRGARLAGHVVDHDGAPVPDFDVAAYRDAQGQFFYADRKRKFHDTQGAFSIVGLPQGTYSLTATTSDGRVGGVDTVVVAEGSSQRDLRIEVARGCSISGRVVDASTGMPVDGAFVHASGRVSGGETTSDKTGDFTLNGLSEGAIQVSVYAGRGVVDDDRSFSSCSATKDVGTIKLVRGAMPAAVTAYDGIDPATVDGIAIVAGVVAGSPADRAGVGLSDALLAVNGHDVHDLGPDAINFYLSGPPGTATTVVFRSAKDGSVHTATFALAAVSKATR